MRMRSVVFDFDGTLVDSRPGIVSSLRLASEAYGLEPGGVGDWVIGPPAEMTIHRLMPNHGEAERREFLAVFRKIYARQGWTQSALYDGIVELLEELRRARLNLLLCTSKRKDLTLRLLDHFGIQSFFSAVAADEEHLESHDKKDLLRGLLEEQKIDPSSCAMVGDCTYDIEAAHAAGAKAVVALYGYGSRQELVAAGAEALCESPREITAAIDLL
jgi:phosphoglycolate phosphatase